MATLPPWHLRIGLLWNSPPYPTPNSHCLHLRSKQLTRSPWIPWLFQSSPQTYSYQQPSFSGLHAFTHGYFLEDALTHLQDAQKVVTQPGRAWVRWVHDRAELCGISRVVVFTVFFFLVLQGPTPFHPFQEAWVFLYPNTPLSQVRTG